MLIHHFESEMQGFQVLEPKFRADLSKNRRDVHVLRI